VNSLGVREAFATARLRKDILKLIHELSNPPYDSAAIDCALDALSDVIGCMLFTAKLRLELGSR
jgi:hypothetical protein